MSDDFYRLHEATEPLPERWQKAPIVAEFNAQKQAFTRIDVKRYLKTQPKLIGLHITCDRCWRWEPVEPCGPEECTPQMEAKGWREEGKKNICPICAESGGSGGDSKVKT